MTPGPLPPLPRRRVLATGLRLSAAAALLGPAGLATACRRTAAVEPGAGLRIAALAPPLSMIARDLGLADRLVARHAYDAWADPALPTVLDQNGIDYPELLRARPTHVLTQWGDRPLPAPLIELSQKHSFVVEDFRFLPIDDIAAALTRFAALFPQSAPLAAGWRSKIDAALVPAPSASAAGRVLLLHSASPPAALGPGSYHHQLLERLGATPALADGSRFMALHAEDVLRIAPDAIVLIQPRAPGATAPNTTPDSTALLGPLANLRIPALAASPPRVARLDDTDALIPGTNIVRLAARLTDILGAFAQARPTSPP